MSHHVVAELDNNEETNERVRVGTGGVLRQVRLCLHLRRGLSPLVSTLSPLSYSRTPVGVTGIRYGQDKESKERHNTKQKNNGGVFRNSK